MLTKDLFCKFFNRNPKTIGTKTEIFNNFSAGLDNDNDLSVLKVYFPETDSVLFKTDVLFAWYDIISDYGGILGLSYSKLGARKLRDTEDTKNYEYSHILYGASRLGSY
jgi:hypothetical protein